MLLHSVPGVHRFKKKLNDPGLNRGSRRVTNNLKNSRETLLIKNGPKRNENARKKLASKYILAFRFCEWNVSYSHYILNHISRFILVNGLFYIHLGIRYMWPSIRCDGEFPCSGFFKLFQSFSIFLTAVCFNLVKGKRFRTVVFLLQKLIGSGRSFTVRNEVSFSKLANLKPVAIVHVKAFRSLKYSV